MISIKLDSHRDLRQNVNYCIRDTFDVYYTSISVHKMFSIIKKE